MSYKRKKRWRLNNPKKRNEERLRYYRKTSGPENSIKHKKCFFCIFCDFIKKEVLI